jgi:hypothetical protein
MRALGLLFYAGVFATGVIVGFVKNEARLWWTNRRMNLWLWMFLYTVFFPAKWWQ